MRGGGGMRRPFQRSRVLGVSKEAEAPSSGTEGGPGEHPVPYPQGAEDKGFLAQAHAVLSPRGFSRDQRDMGE